jgi:tRNA threonylcarbamoyladenosine biosynthesis protein TsaB
MKLLAIDTSTEIASVALMVDGKMRSESLPSQKVQAQKILPMIERLLTSAKLRINQLDGIVFGRGPGSFTGLRIACSVVKGLAYAHNIPLFPVSTLAAIAEEARSLSGNHNQAVLAVLDARMQELYWGFFTASSLEAEEKVSAAANIIQPKDEPWLLAGLGFELYEDVFSSIVGISIHPKANFMINIVQKGGVAAISACDAQPIYIRNSVTQGSKNG